jgi:hypothetical protein
MGQIDDAAWTAFRADDRDPPPTPRHWVETSRPRRKPKKVTADFTTQEIAEALAEVYGFDPKTAHFSWEVDETHHSERGTTYDFTGVSGTYTQGEGA